MSIIQLGNVYLHYNDTMKKILTQQNPLLRGIIQKSYQLVALNQQVKKYLTPQLAQHCNVANLEQGCLTIAAESSAWATQLRYLKGDLLHQLRTKEHLYHLRTIQCIIKPIRNEIVKKTRKAKPISAENLSKIKNTAAAVADDNLRQALLTLATRQEK